MLLVIVSLATDPSEELRVSEQRGRIRQADVECLDESVQVTQPAHVTHHHRLPGQPEIRRSGERPRAEGGGQEAGGIRRIFRIVRGGQRQQVVRGLEVQGVEGKLC